MTFFLAKRIIFSKVFLVCFKKSFYLCIAKQKRRLLNNKKPIKNCKIASLAQLARARDL